MENEQDVEKEKINSFLTKSIDKSFQPRRRLYKKCLQKGFRLELTNKELDHFEELGLINDKELATITANTLHQSNGLVGYALFQKLLQRDIPFEICQSVVQEISELDDELDVALQQINIFDLSDEQQKIKAYNKLKRKGFTTEAIENVIN